MSLERDELVLLVDSTDVVVGVAPKLDVHRDGQLHRAVSVMLFDDRGWALLQRRANDKYHSPGLWSNTCCGHPRPGESIEDAGRRRLSDELGIRVSRLDHVGEFLYFADLGAGLVEHELDHVLVGRWVGTFEPNPEEVSETRWIQPAELGTELARSPEAYTAWTARVVELAVKAREVDGLTAIG